MAHASTSWWCSGGEPIYRVCEFSNLYYRDGSWYAGVGRDRAGLIPAVQVASQHSHPVAPRAVPARRVKAAKAATHHAGLHLVVHQLWTFNIGHALYDGLYASWVALLRVRRDGAAPREAANDGQLRFRVLLSSPGVNLSQHLLFHEALAGFGGNGLLRTEALHGWHRFERVVIGAGGKGQRWTNSDLRLSGSDVGAPARFRNRMYRSFNIIPRRAEPRPRTELRVLIVDNKRYSSGERATLERLVAQYTAAGFGHVRYLEWPRVNGRAATAASPPTSTFAEHMALLGATDVYVSSGGTAMTYAPLLPDGAVFVHLGEWIRRPDNVSLVGWWEEYMLESAPYLRAIYYPTHLRARGLEPKPLKTLIERALHLASKGAAAPAPPLSNLSPDGRLFARACAAERERPVSRPRHRPGARRLVRR